MHLNYREIVFYNAITTLELLYYVLCCEFAIYLGCIFIQNIYQNNLIPPSLWIHGCVVIVAIIIGIFTSLHWRKIVKTLE